VISAVADAVLLNANFLDENGVKPLTVLKKAGLEHADLHSADTVNALYMAYQRHMTQAHDTDSESADDSDLQSEDFDSDAD